MDKSTLINVLVWLVYLGAGGSILAAYIWTGYVLKTLELPLMGRIVAGVFGYGILTMMVAFFALQVIE